MDRHTDPTGGLMSDRLDGQESGPEADERRRRNGIAIRQRETWILQNAVIDHLDRLKNIAGTDGEARALRAVAADPVTGWAIRDWLRAVADHVEAGVPINDAIRLQNDHARRNA
jgi:hypothetical protein